MREALGDHILDRFVEAKTIEWQEYCLQVDSWELDRYLRVY
jgi:glutamine synthetase